MKQPTTKKAAAIFKQILFFGDVLLLAISPLAILMFIVGVIVLLDRYGTHHRFVEKMGQSGLVTMGTIEPYEPADEVIIVKFEDQAQETRWGTLETSYYPSQVLESLEPGGQTAIRYAPSESKVVLDEHFENLRGYWGYAYDVGWVLLVSWGFVIIRPEFLYIGYTEQFDQIFKLRAPL